MSIKEERHQIAELIRQSEFETGEDLDDLTYTCRQILNSFHGKRVISRSEAMVEILKLPLVFCSEIIEVVPISNSVKISEKEGTTFVHKYKNRKISVNTLAEDKVLLARSN